MGPSQLTSTPVETLKGVGPALGEKLVRLGITHLADVLFHLPLRYEDRTRVTPIANIRVGDAVVVEGRVISCDVAFGRRRSLLVNLQDDTGRIALRFFHFSKAQQRNLASASELRCFGEVRRGSAGLEIYHPEYEKSTGKPLDQTLTPVYPSTEGISQSRYRALVSQVLAKLAQTPLEDFGVGNDGPGINEAIATLHQPPATVDVLALQSGAHPAQRRLAYEELMAHYASLRFIREQVNEYRAPTMSAPGNQCQTLRANLGFSLTAAQERVLDEIVDDVTDGKPMLRLLQGDVGSGKTVVAAIAAVQAQESGFQTAIMAPTEVLAEQHFLNFSQWLAPLGIQTSWLTGKVKGKKRDLELAMIKGGTTQVVVGTHALFQKDVAFKRLGLVIIDEQHRFGVHQRLALREKGNEGNQIPHQLVMTATPIPRTLTMSMYADMDASIIDELPPGRTPVTTSVLPESRRAEVIERVRTMCQQGNQAYWVCTLIEESDVLESQGAEATLKELRAALPSLQVGLIHGRMSHAEKTAVMQEFKGGRLNLLVATTVIEVGVDVPNATLMVIENSERLGLAQLHQLRGRVGRGTGTSYCLLLYHPPLGELSKRRLSVMRETNDGFVIAEEDLRIRGPGELLGSRQSGSVQFRVADLIRDSDLLPRLKVEADALFQTDPDAIKTIIRRWSNLPDTMAQV